MSRPTTLVLKNSRIQPPDRIVCCRHRSDDGATSSAGSSAGLSIGAKADIGPWPHYQSPVSAAENDELFRRGVIASPPDSLDLFLRDIPRK